MINNKMLTGGTPTCGSKGRGLVWGYPTLDLLNKNFKKYFAKNFYKKLL
jgi:hypothetical protein